MSTALIVGITGQDGFYLSKLLLEKGYEVHGVVRRASTNNRQRLEHLPAEVQLYYGDLTDGGSLLTVLEKSQPGEVYNLGAMSDVRVSFDVPEYAVDVTATGTIRLLEAIRKSGLHPRFYQASSSEMFGSSPGPQNEHTPFHPRSPYGCAKVFAYWATVNYREAYGMHASNGILFNHESPIRGENFVTRKIVKAAVRIKRGLQTSLALGNLDAKRDWGFAGDYVEAMWKMLQQPESGDYVVATGETHSVREFAEEAFSLLGLDWERFVHTDSSLFRPAEVEYLQGNPARTNQVLDWHPKVSFLELVRMMVESEQKSCA